MAGLPFKQNKNCFPEKGKQCMNEWIFFPLPVQTGAVSMLKSSSYGHFSTSVESGIYF
jgi:hypothetical protein